MLDELSARMQVLAESQPEPTLLANETLDDRDNIKPGDTVLLIVENDLTFARFLLDAAREKGCKGLGTSQGAGALALARDHMPDALTLDIVLPDMDGWRVLDRLKHDLATRHIPVCVVSTEDARERAFETALGLYDSSLQWALRWPVLIMLSLVLTLGGAFYLFTNVPKGFIPQQDNGLMIGGIPVHTDSVERQHAACFVIAKQNMRGIVTLA